MALFILALSGSSTRTELHQTPARLRVLKACAGFSEVQAPVEVHFLPGFDFSVKDIELVTKLPNVKSAITMS